MILWVQFALLFLCTHATPKLASMLTSSGLDCGENGQIDTWLKPGLQSATVYNLSSATWSTGDVTVKKTVRATGAVSVGEGVSAPAISVGSYEAASNGDVRIKGSVVLTDQLKVTAVSSLGTQFAHMDSAKLETTGNVQADWLNVKGTATISNSLTVQTGYSKLKGPVYAEGNSQKFLNSGYPGEWTTSWQARWNPSKTVAGNAAPGIPDGIYVTAGHGVSLYATEGIYTPDIIQASDRRIKKDIEPVPDQMALDILRKLDAKYYHYKDVLKRGPNRTIGFIAQEVREVIPEAVTLVENVIPNEMRGVNVTFEVVDEQIVMAFAEPVAAGVYRFFVSKKEDASDEVERTWTTKDGVHFDVDDHYKNVFLYGQRRDDFHAIDKQKIFAVAYAAAQQVDKNQQALEKRITNIEKTYDSLQDILKLANEHSERTRKIERRISNLQTNP